MTRKKLCGIALLTAMLIPAAGHSEEAPAAVIPAEAETETGIFRLDAAARVDWQYYRPFDSTDDSQTGFKGRYLVIRVDGEITSGLTYSWRQRLNKANGQQSFFDATDWVYVNYAVDGWNLNAGKEVVAIGGWEYDRAPIDLYGCSVFWNNIPCYQLGASVGYNLSQRDKLTVQVTQSPFRTDGMNNIYGYNLMWNGSHGWYESIWSANAMEYAKGRYITYLSLGNRFTAGKCALELDLMNRAASSQAYFFKDCSVMGELSYRPTDRWKLHAKATYDVNRSGTAADMTVADGTELTMAGSGLEFYPLVRNRTSLRLHANAYYSWGRNANAADMMQSRTVFASVGVTWDMNLLNIKKK